MNSFHERIPKRRHFGPQFTVNHMTQHFVVCFIHELFTSPTKMYLHSGSVL